MTSLFENVKGGDVVCTADCPTCRKHYVHNEESTLDDAPQKMKCLRTLIQNNSSHVQMFTNFVFNF